MKSKKLSRKSAIHANPAALLAAAELEAGRTHQEARAAKAELKRAKRAHRQARKAAKRARKALKALAAKWKKAGRKTPKTGRKNKTRPATRGATTKETSTATAD